MINYICGKYFHSVPILLRFTWIAKIYNVPDLLQIYDNILIYRYLSLI